MYDVELNEKLTEDDRLFLESNKHKRNINAFFREDIGIWKVPHSDVDNCFERLRSRIFLQSNKYSWVSRLYKVRKRRKFRYESHKTDL